MGIIKLPLPEKRGVQVNEIQTMLPQKIFPLRIVGCRVKSWLCFRVPPRLDKGLETCLTRTEGSQPMLGTQPQFALLLLVSTSCPTS